MIKNNECNKIKEEIEEILKVKLESDYFDFNGRVYSVEYDESEGTAVIKVGVHIVDDDDYVGFECY